MKLTNSSMLYHLNTKHPQLQKEKDSLDEKQADKKRKREEEQSFLEQSKKARMANIQPTLLNLKDHVDKWAYEHPRAQAVTKLIGEHVAIDHLPYRHVEKPGFKRLIADAYPRYNLPSRTYFQEKVIPSIFKDVKDNITQLLSNIHHVSMTSDEWTSTCAKFAVVSLTCTYLNELFQKRQLTICSRKISGSSANAENVGAALDSGFDDFPGLKAKVVEVRFFYNIHVFLRDC